MRPFSKHWKGNMVIEHIIRRYGRRPLNHHYYVTNYPDVHAAGVRIFGNWKNTIEAAGIDYAEVRKYQTWTKEKIIAQIKKLHADGKPIYSNYAQRHYKSLYMAAVKRFKGWKEAVTLAGIDYNGIRLRRCMTPEELKVEIKRLFENGVSLAYTNMRANYQYLMAAGMKKLGDGSWDAARKACGITVNYRSLAEARKREKKQAVPVSSDSEVETTKAVGRKTPSKHIAMVKRKVNRKLAVARLRKKPGKR